MIRTETIIAVKDVAGSSIWYQALLGCDSGHGGDTFEVLRDADGTVVLCLHKWAAHEHPTMRNPEIPVGNGIILYIKVFDLDKIWDNAGKMEVNIEEEPHYNNNSGKMQFTLRDPDRYYLIISAM